MKYDGRCAVARLQAVRDGEMTLSTKIFNVHWLLDAEITTRIITSGDEKRRVWRASSAS
jgi:hypothetical protein